LLIEWVLDRMATLSLLSHSEHDAATFEASPNGIRIGQWIDTVDPCELGEGRDQGALSSLRPIEPKRLIGST